MTAGAFLERQQIELARGRRFDLGRIIPQPIYMLTVQKENIQGGHTPLRPSGGHGTTGKLNQVEDLDYCMPLIHQRGNFQKN